jgi:sterol 14-demethylase
MSQSSAVHERDAGSVAGAVPPRLGGALPLVGHMLAFGRNPFELMMKARAECGEIAEFKLINQDVVLMTGPEANEAFCRAPDEQLSQKEAYRVMTPVFGEGVVFDAPLEKLNEQLRMLMPALRDRNMRTYAGVIAEEVENLVADWGESGEMDFLAFTQQLTLYTSSHCLLGKEFRQEMTEEFARLYHDLEQGVKAIAYIFPYLPLPAFRRRDRARERLVEMITTIIRKRETSGRKGEDALQTLLESRYSDGGALNADEITGMLTATMFAGHHTSAGTAAWVLIELLRNQQHLAPVVAELDALFGEEGAVTFDSLREMPWLENVILEVLRLHPPLIFLLRKVLYDFRYKGYTVPAGKFLAMSPAVSHRIPEVFPDPERFDPQRYTEEGREGEHPFAWIAFGGGRHRCTGNAFALMQLKAIFSILLRRYEFELLDPPDSYREDYQKMVIQPKEPCRVRYRRRRRAQASQALPVEGRRRGATAEGRAAGTGVRVKVDWDLCQGHAVCMGEAPEIFRVDDKGELTILTEQPPAELRAKLDKAIKYCPTKAISVESD